MGHPFEGIYPALLTPFTKNGAINADALKALIEWNIKKGVAGFYVGGSTAEAFLLTEEERNSLYKIVSEAAEGRVKLIAHIGALKNDSGEAVANAQVKAALQEMITKEDKKHPLTDQQLMELFRQRGINVARRTIAKYRTMLGYENSPRRREY